MLHVYAQNQYEAKYFHILTFDKHFFSQEQSF